MIHAPDRIVTERLLLRVPALQDAPAIFSEYAQDPEVTRYLSWQPDRTIEQVVAFLERTLDNWRQEKAFAWAITLHENGSLIGMIEARIDAYMANIGYVFGRRYWNKGYATEAVKALLQWSDTQEEIFRVWAVCAVDNPASARVLEKAGLEREGILRRWAILPNIGGTPQDCYCYARVKGLTSQR